MEGADLLNAISQASAALAVFSILALLMLYVRRIIIVRIERANAARRAVLADMVYRHLDAPTPEPLSATPLSPRDQRLLLSVISEMLRNVSGDMKDRLRNLLNTHIDLDRMLTALKSRLPADRAKVAARLSWSDSPKVHDALRALLDDPVPEVLLAAAGSLLATGQTINLLTLVPKLESRNMLGNRAVRDLFRRLAPANASALFSLLDDPNPATAVLAIDALARVPSPSALRRLRAAVPTHPSVDVRAAAIRTLGIAQDIQAADVITAALSDPAWEVRAQAAIAAGRIRIAATKPRLVSLMHDGNWWVRLRSAQALARLGESGAAELERLVDDVQLGTLASFVLAERHST